MESRGWRDGRTGCLALCFGLLCQILRYPDLGRIGGCMPLRSSENFERSRGLSHWLMRLSRKYSAGGRRPRERNFLFRTLTCHFVRGLWDALRHPTVLSRNRRHWMIGRCSFLIVYFLNNKSLVCSTKWIGNHSLLGFFPLVPIYGLITEISIPCAIPIPLNSQTHRPIFHFIWERHRQ